jgi:hypothetical protein
MRAYAEPPFLEPLSSTFVYVGWCADPARIGPFVRHSNERRDMIDEIRRLARRQTDRSEVEAVRLFETSFMPPLRDLPMYDLILLARAPSREGADKLVHDEELAETKPATAFLASNGARFGATEGGAADANILLNHFVGPSDRSSAVGAWRQISAWYASEMGMDNSMLLRTEDDAPFVLVNCVRLPSNVVVFLLNQLLRPSFHRYVRVLLKRHQLTSLPLFVRNVPIESTRA